MSIKASNSRRLVVAVVATGLLAMGGNSAHAGYQVAIEVIVPVPASASGECNYNFGGGGCNQFGPDSTGFVNPSTSPPDNSGTATAASAGISGGGTLPVSGSVSADLSTASVHLAASSTAGTTSQGSAVSEYGNYSDTLHYTVAGAGPTTVTPIGFTFTIDGLMSGAGPFASGSLNGEVQYGGRDARFILLLDSSTGYQTAIVALDTYPSNAPGIWTHNAALTQFTYTDTFDVTGASGSFPILLDSQLICEYGVTCNYGDTLQAALNPPTDAHCRRRRPAPTNFHPSLGNKRTRRRPWDRPTHRRP